MTLEEKPATIKIDTRCPHCGRLWFKTLVPITRMTPVRHCLMIEIKCPNCDKIVDWPIVAIPD